jgi:hypothetical protein
MVEGILIRNKGYIFIFVLGDYLTMLSVGALYRVEA